MDQHQTLGVITQADEKEIKKVHRKLAGKHHSDKGGDENEFKKIQQAYETPSDPQNVSNTIIPNSFEGGDPLNRQGGFNFRGDFGDIFGDIFGRGFQQRQPNEKPRRSSRFTFRTA